jgi:hypothetical protein
MTAKRNNPTRTSRDPKGKMIKGKIIHLQLFRFKSFNHFAQNYFALEIQTEKWLTEK